jgi:hypothetical protein
VREFLSIVKIKGGGQECAPHTRQDKTLLCCGFSEVAMVANNPVRTSSKDVQMKIFATELFNCGLRIRQ